MTEPASQSVSVVIPCYNGMPYLPEALDSVLAQTHRPAQIIVVDDGSIDASADCVLDFRKRFADQPIELIQQDNAGESAARNAGIKASTSTWIAQVDADDWWDPRKLELQLQAAVERGVECVLVHTGQITHDHDGHVDASSLKRAGERVGWCTDKLIEPVGISHSSVMARRDTLNRIGGYDADLRHAVDIDVYFRLSAEGVFAFVAEHLTHYRIHGGQTSWHHKLEQIRHHHAVIRRFFDSHTDLAGRIGHDRINAALAEHVASKLESFWWNRRLAEFRQLLAFADEQGYQSESLGTWRDKAHWPDWMVRLKGRVSGAGSGS